MRVFIRIIAFTIIIGLGLYFYKPELFVKDNYDIDTLNINKYIITPSPGNIYAMNLKVSSSNEYNINSLGGAIQLYFDSINIFEIRILELLENSNDKKSTLNTYIKQLEYTQSKLENAISSLENTITEEEIKYDEYLSLKKQGDSQFSEGFSTRNSNLSVQGFDMAIKNGPSSTQHRIVKNAGKITVKKLGKIKQLIDSKLIILETNKDTITNNFYIIKGDLLKKLRKLKYQLETNRYITD